MAGNGYFMIRSTDNNDDCDAFSFSLATAYPNCQPGQNINQICLEQPHGNLITAQLTVYNMPCTAVYGIEVQSGNILGITPSTSYQPPPSSGSSFPTLIVACGAGGALFVIAVGIMVFLRRRRTLLHNSRLNAVNANTSNDDDDRLLELSSE